MKTMKKFKYNLYFKRCLIILFLLTLFIYISAISYVHAVSNDISESVFRLHVIANSDSVEDQNLKYKVRDNVINYMNSLCSSAASKEEAIKLAKEHTDEFYNIAKQTVIDNGYSYDIKINIGNFDFPTKQYGDISLPAGSYDALRIEIGKANGQNWWCVMFPPLCFVDVSSGIVPEESKETIKKSLSNEEEYVLINEDKNTDIKFKFKLIEMFQNVKIKTAKK
jgi:stage II sporulation protein R